MGKLTQGILGQISGKVGGVVGGTWKDKNYLRGFVIPANPQTIAQQAWRAKFGAAVAFGKLILGEVLNPFQDQFLPTMSGFNFFIKTNVDYFDPVVVWASVLLIQGKLHMGTVTGVNFSATMNAGSVEWTTENGNNGLATDKICCVVLNKTTGIIAFSAAPTNRSVGSTIVNIQMTAADEIQVWAFAVKMDGSKVLLVSNSGTDDCVASA